MATVDAILRNWQRQHPHDLNLRSYGTSYRYDDFVAMVLTDRRHDGWRSWLGDLGAVAWIGSCLGATNISPGVTTTNLKRLRGEKSDYEGWCPSGSLFDHCMVVRNRSREVGLIARPYLSDAARAQAAWMARDPRILVWTTGSERCSWVPGSTQTWVITRLDGDLTRLGFERVQPVGPMLVPCKHCARVDPCQCREIHARYVEEIRRVNLR